ncbi:unnamed protein product, partial [Scytosiphon promiscuus]
FTVPGALIFLLCYPRPGTIAAQPHRTPFAARRGSTHRRRFVSIGVCFIPPPEAIKPKGGSSRQAEHARCTRQGAWRLCLITRQGKPAQFTIGGSRALLLSRKNLPCWKVSWEKDATSVFGRSFWSLGLGFEARRPESVAAGQVQTQN